MLKDLNKTFLIDNGFIVFDSLLNDEEISEPCNLIEEALTKCGIPKSKEEASKWVKQKSPLQSNKAILGLRSNIKVDALLREIFSDTILPIKSSQIATRFPGENCTSGLKWHIDNYTEKDFARRSIPADFTCLLGVYLTDNVAEDAGNFTVFPGSHFQIQSFSRLKGGKEYYRESGLDEAISALQLQNSFQVKAKRGSVILVHRHLAHLISSPNRSSVPRTIVWFRLRVKRNYDDNETFLNIWKEWLNLSIEQHVEPKYSEEIESIQLRGYGYLKSATDTQLILRLKPNGKKHQPCIYGSMVTLKYSPEDKVVRAHTNGFISNSKHHLIAKHLMDNCSSLLEMAEWIYNCDYRILIEQWCPIITCKPTREADKSNMHVVRLHHLHSRSKSSMMFNWATEMNISGMIIMGKPGYLIIKGENADVLLARFKCYHWLHYKVLDNASISNNFTFDGFKKTNEIPFGIFNASNTEHNRPQLT
jgi:hypothetical protein